MNKAIAISTILGGLAASAAVLAQVQPVRQVPAPTMTFPVPRVPGVPVQMEKQRGTVNVGPREMKVVQLNRVPESALRVESWPGLNLARTAPASAGGISSAGATIYVRKTWLGTAVSNIGFGCAEKYDTLDLSGPRSHGFRLHAVTIEPLPPPAKFVNGPPRRKTPPYFDAAGAETEDPALAVRVKLRAPAYQLYLTPAIPVSCFTGYRANISLFGPANIDPFTGQAIVRDRVN